MKTFFCADCLENSDCPQTRCGKCLSVQKIPILVHSNAYEFRAEAILSDKIIHAVCKNPNDAINSLRERLVRR